MQHPIHHQDSGSSGRFFLDVAGRTDLAEMTYRREGSQRIVIDHTEVDPSLGGQGVGRALLDALVEWARGGDLQVVPTCSYARAQFEKDPALRDVLA